MSHNIVYMYNEKLYMYACNRVLVGFHSAEYEYEYLYAYDETD